MSDRPSRLSDQDVYLFNEGRHLRLQEKLGAHLEDRDGVPGCSFAVWAPNARAVSLICDRNGWQPGLDPLQPRAYSHRPSGIWEGFVPGIRHGDRYKFHIESNSGYRVDKADPFARFGEVPPQRASVVWDLQYRWGDEAWLAQRRLQAQHGGALQQPISIYELHLGSWLRPDGGETAQGAHNNHNDHNNQSGHNAAFLSYRDLAPRLAAYVHELGFTHVELLPVMEHPFYGSWGYQVTGFFAPTSRYGTPQDLMFLIDTLHQHGIGVIVDFVPSHFPADEHGLGYFDGTHLFEHEDRRLGLHPEWNSLLFNYDRHEVRSFLLSSALHWLATYHADGLRVDGVASMLYLDYSRKPGEWLPNAHGGRENLGAIHFLRSLNADIERLHPDVLVIAEESSAFPQVTWRTQGKAQRSDLQRPSGEGSSVGLGFDLKWDMGWMHDTLKYLALDPIYRRYHHTQLTFRGMYADSEHFLLSLSHDEVVHMKGSLYGKLAGDDWQKRANLRLLYAQQWSLPGKKLLFMGGEFGQVREWDHERQLDWFLLDRPEHRGIFRWLCDLNALLRCEPALSARDFDAGGFVWLDPDDADHSVLSFLRVGPKPDDTLLIVLNFTPVPRSGYRLGVPRTGPWRELLNSDAAIYGGSGQGNMGEQIAVDTPHQRQPASLQAHLPPLSALFFKHG